MLMERDRPSYQAMSFRQEAQQEAERLGLGETSQSFLTSAGAAVHTAGVIWSALLLLLFASLFLTLGIVSLLLSFVPPLSLDIGKVFGEMFILLITGGVAWFAYSNLRKELAAVKYHDREQLHIYREGFVYLEPNARGKRAARWDQIEQLERTGDRNEYLRVLLKNGPDIVLETTLQKSWEIAGQVEQAFLRWKLARAQEQWERGMVLTFSLTPPSPGTFRFLGLDKECLMRAEFTISDLAQVDFDEETKTLLEKEEALNESEDYHCMPRGMTRALAKEQFPWSQIAVREANNDQIIIAAQAAEGGSEQGNAEIVVREDEMIADFGLLKALIAYQTRGVKA